MIRPFLLGLVIGAAFVIAVVLSPHGIGWG
jgi:hypothetical protein